jgi:hypothetical protein
VIVAPTVRRPIVTDTIAVVVTRPSRVVMSELLIRPDGSRW